MVSPQEKGRGKEKEWQREGDESLWLSKAKKKIQFSSKMKRFNNNFCNANNKQENPNYYENFHFN